MVVVYFPPQEPSVVFQYIRVLTRNGLVSHKLTVTAVTVNWINNDKSGVNISTFLKSKIYSFIFRFHLRWVV